MMIHASFDRFSNLGYYNIEKMRNSPKLVIPMRVYFGLLEKK